MSCEEEIKRLLLNTLRTGILRIRAFGWDHLADRCAVEADHIHNLAGLVLSPRLELLNYYGDIEHPTFIKRVSDSGVFEPHWLRLGELIGEMRGDANDNKPE